MTTYVPGCGCIDCAAKRSEGQTPEQRMAEGIRFACELCGNKRCPHNTSHELACTRSNRPGQRGSIYE